MSKVIARISGVIVDSTEDDDWNAEYIDKGIITPASRFAYQVGTATDELEVRINSYGGDVFAGNTMSIALQQWAYAHPEGKLTIVVEAIALSAAACIVARAPRAANVLAYPESLIMFHSASTMAMGGPGVMKDAAALMDKINQGIIAAILFRTTLGKDEVVQWFQEGREGWLTGMEAQACMLVDRVMIDQQAPEAPAVSGGDTATPRMAAVAAVYTSQSGRLAKHLTQKGTTTMNKAPIAEEDPEKKLPEEPFQEDPTPVPEEPEKKPDEDIPAQEDPTPVPEEPEKKPDEDEIAQLKQQLAATKAELDVATAKLAKLTAGFHNGRTPADQPKGEDVAAMLRNIPANASLADQAKALNHIRNAHPQAYQAYMDAHQKRYTR